MTQEPSIYQDPLEFVKQLIQGKFEPKRAIQDILRFQLQYHPFYERFASQLYPEQTELLLSGLEEFPENSIPLVPIRAFKEIEVVLPKQTLNRFSDPSKTLVFKSSGTSNMVRSHHYIPFPQIYEQSVMAGFAFAYSTKDLTIISYLPGYRDNTHSSLIYMMRVLMRDNEENLAQGNIEAISLDHHILSQPEELYLRLKDVEEPILLFGAAFGLVDFLEQMSEKIPIQLPNGSVIVETGGMKTHRREIPKSELQSLLSNGFGIPIQQIHSEYGMCEMSSQAYAKGSEWFTPPPWLNFQIRHPDAPLTALPPGVRGKLGILDMCNLFSCPFILTDDEAEINEKGEIKLYGRWPGEEARGCNYLIDRD